MATQRAHVSLPEDLIREIDEVVGPRGRSAFLVETARAELRRRWLLDFFSKDEPIWKDEDHPEWANGGVEGWVSSLREGWDTRLGKVWGDERDREDGTKDESKAEAEDASRAEAR